MRDKIRILVVGTGKVIEKTILRLKAQNNFQVMGIVPDSYVNQQDLALFIKAMESYDIPIKSFSDIDSLAPTCILVNEYRRIIPVSEFSHQLLWINVHAGLLPKYRGFHANAWALLNGEDKIGYTVHQMNEYADDGPIFYRHEFSIHREQTYSEIRPKITGHMIEHMGSMIENIVNKKVIGIPQKGEAIFYCGKIRAEDGCIGSWDMETDLIFNWYRVMDKPAGTGLYTFYKGKRIGIEKISLKKVGEDYRGVPGMVVNVLSDGGIWIKTKDNAIEVSLIEMDGKLIRPGDYFKNNMRFGRS